jgi:hypothetical protein
VPPVSEWNSVAWIGNLETIKTHKLYIAYLSEDVNNWEEIENISELLAPT